MQFNEDQYIFYQTQFSICAMKITREAKFVKILDNLGFIVLSLIGFYLIFSGDVIERFRLKRTNFAEYSETVSELPTIQSRIISSANFTFGHDFDIVFEAENDISMMKPSENQNYLKMGENSLEDSFKVILETMFCPGVPNFFKVTPIGFPHGQKMRFKLAYVFKNLSGLVNSAMPTISAALASENNSIPIKDSYTDGEVEDFLVNVGNVKLLTTYPEKYIYDPDLEKCRNRPYNEIVIQKIAGVIKEKCSNPCQAISFGKHLNQILGNLPICTNQTHLKCFMDLLQSVLSSNEVTEKPCTKLQYKTKGSSPWSLSNPSEARFSIDFAIPLKMIVKEEYLIFDLMSMISAMGGTMGLFVGYSFRDSWSVLLKNMLFWMALVSKRASFKGDNKTTSRVGNQS